MKYQKMEYPTEVISNKDDDGTMPNNVAKLTDAVVGHRIVSAEKGPVKHKWHGSSEGLIITLDNGKRVSLANTSDCCAFTELKSFLLHPERVDHIIMGVGTTDKYQTWHIFADFGDIMELKVGWSSGNPFYYCYGFDIHVEELNDEE